MLYVIIGVDKPGSRELRRINRPDHLAYLEQHAERLFAAGPLLGDDGDTVVGSLIVIDCPDREAAEQFSRADPYRIVGLFESADIKAWRKVFPKQDD